MLMKEIIDACFPHLSAMELYTLAAEFNRAGDAKANDKTGVECGTGLAIPDECVYKCVLGMFKARGKTVLLVSAGEKGEGDSVAQEREYDPYDDCRFGQGFPGYVEEEEDK